MKLRAIGQSTFVVTTVAGAVVVTDPWFGEHPLARRAIPLPPGFDALPACDAVLASHNHVDHVDGSSLRAAARYAAVVVGPPAIARRARREGVRDARALLRGQHTEVAGVRVEAVFASHPLCVRPVGFLLTDVDGTTLYHCGDTRYDPRIAADLAGRQIDAACVQIAAATYPGLGRDGMNVTDAGRLVTEIDAQTVVPMHFHVRGKTTDPTGLTTAAPGRRVRVLAPGECAEIRR